MERIEYLRLLLKGLEEYPDSLEGYFFRECKTAESQFIDYEEFFLGLNKAIDSLYQNIDKRYYEQLNMIEMVRSIRLKEGKPIDDLVHQLLPKEEQYAFLPEVSNSTFLGNLHFSFINKLEQAVLKTLKKVLAVELEAVGKKMEAINNTNSLTSYQKALRQWHLEEHANIAKLQGRAIGRELGQTSAEGFLNNIRRHYDKYKSLDGTKKGLRQDLQAVHDSLSEYPNVQKLIINNISQLD